MIIAGELVAPGETRQINARIAKLPTRTSIDIPIIVSRSKKDGPILLLTGGLHGDEINGVEIVRRFISRGYNKPEKGTVICIPIINIFGFLNFSREVPDGKDVNRSFPGSSQGSLASRVAYHLMQDVVKHIDFGIDFHTGGARINNVPQIRANLEVDEQSKNLAYAFAPPLILNAPYRDRSFRKEAHKLGKSILIYEAGESMRLRKNAIETGIDGALRVMEYTGMISSSPDPQWDTVLIDKSSWLRARYAGIHHAFVRNGAFVTKGEVLGLITDPFGDFERKVKSPSSGYVIAINNNPVVNRGDALLHIGNTHQDKLK